VSGGLRWWDGHAWTERTGKDPRRWSLVLLWLGMAAVVWLGSSWFSLQTASDIAATPQPNQASGVLLFEVLPAAPIAGALIGWLVAFGITRRLSSATTTAAIVLLCLSPGLIFVAAPKPP
jgi:hypothetical protein